VYKKADSLESKSSSLLPDANSDRRDTITAMEKTIATIRKTVNHGMNVLSEKAWRELAIPERVRKVPKMVSKNVIATRMAVQPRNIRRLRVMMTAWTKAVAVSQGIREAFSTGSQAQ
jgi:hypothetical protein